MMFSLEFDWIVLVDTGVCNEANEGPDVRRAGNIGGASGRTSHSPDDSPAWFDE